MAKVVVKIEMRLPWWWRLYMHAVFVADVIGVIDADFGVASAFVIRHSKIKVREV